jgi:hypothetical protein
MESTAQYAVSSIKRKGIPTFPLAASSRHSLAGFFLVSGFFGGKTENFIVRWD